jgi:L-lactate dehydrogenase complex protein LldG
MSTATTREDILAGVRAHQPAAVALPELPAFAHGLGAGTFDRFAASLQRMGGRLADGPATDVVQRLFPEAKVVCSLVPEVPGNRSAADLRHARDLDDVDVGVVRAAFGVAETGSVLLTEAELMPNAEAIGFLSQHLVVLLDPAAIVATLHDAYVDARVAAAHYAIFMTGPSATADIEGILIHGAQGVRSLTVVMAAVAPAPA